MEISTEENAAGLTNGDLLSEFGKFNQRGYAFSAVPNGFVGWLLRRAWIIPLSIILIIILFNLTALLIIEDDSIAIDIALIFADLRTNSDVYIVDCNPDEKIDPLVTCITENTVWTASMVEDSVVYLIPFFFIFLIASILYTVFIHRAPKSFYLLAKNNRLIRREIPLDKPKRIQPKGSLTYVRDFENALKSRWGKIFALIFQILIFILVFIFAVQRKSIDIIQSGFLPISIGEITLIFLIPLVIGFLAGLGIWVIIVVGIYLRQLTPSFKLNMQPYHYDGCGGLKPIGDIAMLMALIYIGPGILLAIWALRGLLGQSIPAVAYLTYSLLLLMIVLSLVTFLLPMTRVHREMARQRKLFEETYLDMATSRLQDAKNRLRQLVVLGEDQEKEGRELKYSLELLEKLYPDRVIFRTWPFGQTVLLTFAVGQTLQFIPLIFGWISGLFKDILIGGGVQ